MKRSFCSLKRAHTQKRTHTHKHTCTHSHIHTRVHSFMHNYNMDLRHTHSRADITPLFWPSARRQRFTRGDCFDLLNFSVFYFFIFLFFCFSI